MTMNNNIAGEFYVLDKYNKTFNVMEIIYNGNMMIHSLSSRKWRYLSGAIDIKK